MVGTTQEKETKTRVTEKKVVETAYQIMNEGKAPTGEAVRARTGGSPVTVNKYMPAFWRDVAIRLKYMPDIPEEAVELVVSFYKLILGKAIPDARAEIEKELEDRTKELGAREKEMQNRVEVAEREQAAALALHKEASERLDKLQGDNHELLARNALMRDESATLKAKAEQFDEKLGDRERKIGELTLKLEETQENHKQEITELKAQLQASQLEEGLLKGRIEQITTAHNEQVESLQDSLEKAKKYHEGVVADMQEQIDQRKEDGIKMAVTIEELQKAAQQHEEALQTANKQTAASKAESIRTNSTLSKAKEEVASLRTENQSLRAEGVRQQEQNERLMKMLEEKED